MTDRDDVPTILAGDLAAMSCAPCRGDTPRLTEAEVADALRRLPGWSLADGGTALAREWSCRNWRQAMAMVGAVSEVAEAERHHPDVEFGWGYLRLRLTTHALAGLSANDPIMAAKVDAALAGMGSL